MRLVLLFRRLRRLPILLRTLLPPQIAVAAVRPAGPAKLIGRAASIALVSPLKEEPKQGLSECNHNRSSAQNEASESFWFRLARLSLHLRPQSLYSARFGHFHVATASWLADVDDPALEVL